MAEKNQKCPICNTKLKMMNGRMTCKQCGYYVQEAGSEDHYDEGSAPQQSYQSQPSSTTTTTKKNDQHLGVLIWTVVGVVAAVMIVTTTLIINRLEFLQNPSTNEASYQVLPDNKESGQEGNSNWDFVFNNSAENAGESTEAVLLPRSSLFLELLEYIFDKSYWKVTQEELDSVIALRIDSREYSLYYQTSAGESEELSLASTAKIDLSDLKYFRGLQWLSLEREELSKGDLDGLEYLYAVYSENSLPELVKIISHPEVIEELGVVDSVFEKDLEGIENFPNLLYLSLEYRSLEDISALKQFPNLLGLTLIDCIDLMDYSPLMSLTNLEELYIQSKQLKTLDFITVMPNLTYLRIEDSQVNSLEVLNNCPNLTTVYFEGNYYIDDYSPIGNLSELQDLTLLVTDMEDTMPSFENLTKLTWLTVSKLEELDSLTGAVNLTTLYLDDCFAQDLTPLADLPQLTYLSLVDCSFYTAPYLEPLKNLPITYLDLSDTYIFGNMESVFAIPNLQALYLNKVTGVLDFDNVAYNESLLVLSMDKMRFKTEAYGNDFVELKDHYEIFDNFPNLQSLNLVSTGIDRLDFVEKLPNLQYLDITNNNVTSLKPLENLTFFRQVRCGMNSILESVSEDSGIYVDMTSTSY